MSMMGGTQMGAEDGYQPLTMQHGESPRDNPTGGMTQWNDQQTGGTMGHGMEKPGNTLPMGKPNAMHTHAAATGHGAPGIDAHTGFAPRRCTDVSWCFLFLVYCTLCFTLVFNAHQHGDIGRLTHGTDYYGRTCGVDSGVENMPYLFWCRADATTTGTPASLNLDFPSCVPFCPGGDPKGGVMAVQVPCLQKNTHQVSQVTKQQFGNTRTMVFQFQESIVNTAPYATTPRGGRYCMPRDTKLAEVIESDNRALGVFSSNRVLTTLGTLGHLYWLLAICCVVSCLCGYAFMYAIKFFPKSIVYPFTVPGVLLFGVFALCFTFGFLPLIDVTALKGINEWYMKQNPFFRTWPTTLACVWSMISAVVCWLMMFCFYNMTQNFDSLSNDVSTADLLGCAAECTKAVGGMWWIPLFQALTYFIVFFLGLQGFRVLASEGWIEKNRLHVNGASFAGLSREMIPATEDWRFYLQAVVWLVGFRWMMEIVTAFAQFITCWCVFAWWRVQKEDGKKASPPRGTVCDGVKNAVGFHMGSLFLGAATIPIWRPWRFAYWATSELDPEKTTNCFAKAFKCCCCCCVNLIGSLKERCQEEIQDESSRTKDAFNDVVIRSNDFGDSVEKAHNLLEHSHKIVQGLYRSLWPMTLHIIAVSTSSSITAGVVYLVVANVGMYKNATSDLYIADPFLVTFLAFLLSSYITSGFMNLWDHTSDCLLYCYVWQRRWNRKLVDKHCPDSLRFIVGFDDTEADRYPYYGRAKNNMYLRTWMPMALLTGKHAGGGH